MVFVFEISRATRLLLADVGAESSEHGRRPKKRPVVNGATVTLQGTSRFIVPDKRAALTSVNCSSRRRRFEVRSRMLNGGRRSNLIPWSVHVTGNSRDFRRPNARVFSSLWRRVHGGTLGERFKYAGSTREQGRRESNATQAVAQGRHLSEAHRKC